MQIRVVERGDIDDFVRVYAEAYRGLENYAYTRRREIKNYFRWLYSRDREGFFVAMIDEAVGFVACDTNWISIFERQKVGEIHELFVLPEYQGKGIGKKLLERAISYSKEKRRKIAELWVGRANFRARKFYIHQGFREAGEWGKWIRMIRDL